MQDITFEKLVGAVAVLLILVGAYKTIMDAIRIHREEKRIRNSPIASLKERVDRHDTLLAKDKDRLDQLDAQMKDMRTESTIILRGVRALLSHEINGNSNDKLKSSMSEIDEYLISRK